MDRFGDLMLESKKMGETNDCVVKCLSVVTSVPYTQVHSVCRLFGRLDRCGMRMSQWTKALRYLGYDLVDNTDYYRAIGGKTAKTVSAVLPKKPCIVRFSGHLAGWNGKELVDWTKNRKHRVIGVYALKVHFVPGLDVRK